MLNPIEYHHDHQHLLIKPKKCKIDSEQFPVDGDLAAFIGQYALFYYWKDDNNKKSAIPLTTSLAATFRQGRKKELKIDDQFEIHSWADKEFKVATRVVRILEDLDTIVLQSNVKLCNVDHIIDSAIPKKGMRSVIVVRNFNGRKVGYILGSPNHQISCVSISPCGRYVASGECGVEPAVRVYEIGFNKNQLQYSLHHELKHHSTEIVAVKFVPKSLYLVSVGCEQDAQIALWNWKTSELLASSKLSASVNSIAMSPDGSFFVTTGARHVKYWTIPTDSEQKTIQSRSAILADKRSSTFVDCVVVNLNKTLAVTNQGEIVEFWNKKYAKAYMFENIIPTSIAYKADQILLGCTDGSTHCCSENDMTFVNQLPFPAPSNADPSVFHRAEELQIASCNTRCPSVCAVQSFPNGDGVVCIHEDKSFYVYLPHGSHWQRIESQLSHSSCVNALLPLPGPHNYLPVDAFFTASSDFTVRIWSFDNGLSESLGSSNLLSPNLIKLITLPDQCKETASSSDVGALSVSVTPDGSHLIAGTSLGNLHVYDIAESEISLVESIMAHDGAVKCSDFSSFRDLPLLFASGGTDHLVHLFRRSANKYIHCGVIEDHEDVVTSIKFAESNGAHRIFSSSQDRIFIWSIVFHEDSIDFGREHVINCSHNVNDLCYWQNRNLILAGCSDWSVRGYEASGKSLLSLGVPVDQQIRAGYSMTSIAVDPSHTFTVVTSTNGSCYMLDLRSGSIVATFAPSGNTPVQACFSEDCKRVIIVSSNGSLYAWRLATPIVNQMLSGRRNLLELAPRTPTPDSLLGSGSEALSEELHISSIGDKLSDFGSTSSLDQSASAPVIVLSPGNSKSLSLSVQEAQVTRRSNNNLLDISNDIDDTQSDFISRQRNVPQYQSSKSMLNLREGNYTGYHSPNVVNGQAQRKVRPSWGSGMNYERKYSPNYSENNNSISKQPERQYHQVALDATPTIMDYSHFRSAGIDSTPQNHVLPSYVRRNTEILSRSPNMAPPAYSKQMSSSNSPSSFNRHNDLFGRNDSLRVSLSRKHLENANPESKSLWTSHSMTPKRTMSSLQAQTSPSGGAASAITRRHFEVFPSRSGIRRDLNKAPPQNRALRSRTVVICSNDFDSAKPSLKKKTAEDYSNSQLHLRSRSQSPNRFKLSQSMTPTSRDITKSRRDSDMSYTAMSSRMTPATSRSNLRETETRKSTDALNKVNALRSKMYQSTENLRKSTDNLLLGTSESESPPESTERTRTRSISNMRGGHLEMAGSFNPDHHSTPSRGLVNSRILARSMGNVNDPNAMAESPTTRLQNTIDKMKKASNPDLTNDGFYEETSTQSPEKLRRRSALQKRVERYHPRRSQRLQTSDESDSNTSEATVRLGDGPDSQQLMKHVEECCDQFQTHIDKLLYARKMVEASKLSGEQKRFMNDLMQNVSELSMEKLQNGFRSSMIESNGNDYTPSKAPNKIYELRNTNF
ncbi:unnamed protein product [Auanema sp. JU1783]|nr:unnamed protein product [Auanema sp. JU1783]